MAGSQKSKDKYLKEKVDTVLIRVPKGQKQVIQDYAKSKGKSLNAFVYDLIQDEIGLDRKAVILAACEAFAEADEGK